MGLLGSLGALFGLGNENGQLGLLLVLAPRFLVLLDLGEISDSGENWTSSGSASVVLGHNVPVVADDTAGSIPGLVDANALDSTDVQVCLSVDATDWLELSVTGTVVVHDDLARLLVNDFDDENRIACRGTLVSVSATIGAADGCRAVSSASLETTVNLLALVTWDHNLLWLAGTVVSDRLIAASGEAFIVEGVAVSAANGQVNVRTSARALWGGWQAGAPVANLGLVTLQVADVVVGLAVLAADSGQVTDAVYALLNGTGLATAFKSFLDFLALKFALVDVVAAIDSTDWLV